MPKGGSRTKSGNLYRKITKTKKQINETNRRIKMLKLMQKNKSRVISA